MSKREVRVEIRAKGSSPKASGFRQLEADCERCFGLCCVAPAFSASADFAIDKGAGEPCLNLQADFRCGIHDRLPERGFRGCAVFDCFGAGQRIAQQTFGGRDWRPNLQASADMFEAFAVMRSLHELLWYLTEALRFPEGASLQTDLTRALDEIDRLASGDAAEVISLDVPTLRSRANALLVRVSDLVRKKAARRKQNYRSADLAGALLHKHDLCGANLRGAVLLAADMREADLRLADVTGADMRDADLRGADLSTTIFLTQSQLRSAQGDKHTLLPDDRIRPDHWAE